MKFTHFVEHQGQIILTNSIGGEFYYPKNPLKMSGVAISFAWTTDTFLKRLKTQTRRFWKVQHANKFRAGMIVRALNKNYAYGGKQIGHALILKDPYQQKLKLMTQADYVAEGGKAHWRNRAEYIEFMGGPEEEPWVVEFCRVEPLNNEGGDR
jgi:hypothetical protein